MLPPDTVRGYVRATPFRPFLLKMASGQSFEIRHPEMVKVLKSTVVIFSPDEPGSEFPPDRFDTVSLMLAESIAHVETPVA